MIIVVAGDSLPLPRPHRINEYNPLTEKSLAVHLKETYSYLLQMELNRKYPERDSMVINRSQRAYTIKHISSQFTDHLYFFEPDIIILHVGIVDLWYRKELGGKQYVSIDEFTQIYNQLILQMKNRPTTKLIIIGISPTSHKMEAKYPGVLKEIVRYNQVLKSRVDHNQIFFIDMAKHIDSSDPHRYLLPDDHHLNKEGNRLVYGELSPIIHAFILNEKGFKLFEKGKIEEAFDSFVASFRLFPGYVDNLYNLLGMAIERNDYRLIEDMTSIIVHLGIGDCQLNEMLMLLSPKNS